MTENGNEATWQTIPPALITVGDEIGWGGKRVGVLGLSPSTGTGRRYFFVGCPRTFLRERNELEIDAGRAAPEVRYFGHHQDAAFGMAQERPPHRREG